MRWSYGPVSVLEVCWTLSGLVGSLNVWFLFLAALGDERYIRRERLNGIRLIVARMSLRVEGVYLYTLLSFALIGVFAATQPPGNPHKPITPTAVLTTVLFFSISALMNLDAYRRRRDRNAVIMRENQRAMTTLRGGRRTDDPPMGGNT